MKQVPGVGEEMKRDEIPICQSCGTPLQDPRFRGTDQENARVQTYCIFCFQDGRFTEPKLTMEEMGWRIHRVLVQQASIPAREAVTMIDGILPKLERWRKVNG